MAYKLNAIIPNVNALFEESDPWVRMRTKAQELILPLMTHVGHKDMDKVVHYTEYVSFIFFKYLNKFF
jgi:hypothetical protein